MRVTAGESKKLRTKKTYSPIDNKERRDKKYNGFDNNITSSGS